jgi:CCR4-NOT transcription complex subunit 1
MKRIPVEQNYHTVYNDFLKSVDNEDLNSYIKRETYRNISILMRSDKRQAASNFSDRQLLKSLGHWLGLITIARDQPILSVDMDLKSLLRDSFYGGQQELLYVVPFIAKCLSAASISKVFLEF